VVAGIAGQQKIAGIVGGLGPETGFRFCLEVNNAVKAASGGQPCLLLENAAVPSRVERDIVSGKASPEMFEILAGSVRRLNSAGADFIVIPCNTAHVFMERLRGVSAVPIFSVIDETAEECKSRGFKMVGLLGTSTTANSQMHQRALSGRGIKAILPDEGKQKEIDGIILRILEGRAGSADKASLSEVIEDLQLMGAEAVILGCTDLGLLINQGWVGLPLIDTLSVLEESTVRELLGENLNEMGI
jgi:aspartate racemase